MGGAWKQWYGTALGTWAEIPGAINKLRRKGIVNTFDESSKIFAQVAAQGRQEGGPWGSIKEFAGSVGAGATSVPGRVAERAQESLEYYVDLSLQGEREGNWLKTLAGRLGGGLSALATKENMDKTVLTLGGGYIAAPALATAGPVMTWGMAGKGALNTTIDAGMQLATKGKIDDYGSLVRSFAVGAASVPAADKLLPVISKMPVVGQIVTQAATKMPIATQVATSAIANGLVGGGSQIVGNVATGKEWHDQVLETAAMDALFGGGGELAKAGAKGISKAVKPFFESKVVHNVMTDVKNSARDLATRGTLIIDDVWQRAASKVRYLDQATGKLATEISSLTSEFGSKVSSLIIREEGGIANRLVPGRTTRKEMHQLRLFVKEQAGTEIIFGSSRANRIVGKNKQTQKFIKEGNFFDAGNNTINLLSGSRNQPRGMIMEEIQHALDQATDQTTGSALNDLK